MRARVWAPVTVGVLLVAGVLGVRGGSAADDADLVVAPPPPSEAEPTPAASEEGGAEEAVLSAEGVAGIRLGGPPTGLVTPITGAGGEELTADDLPGGCVPGYEAAYAAERTWEARAWVVDDVVASVLVVRRDEAPATGSGLRTWLGPTLGSPIQAAGELEGARVRTERPFGVEGPGVRVVVVPGDGVEVVFSDAVYDMDAVPEQERGRISTIEVRRPDAVACSEEAISEVYLSSLEPPAVEPVVGLDGLVTAPIGSPASVLETLPGAQPEGTGAAGCQAFVLAAGEGAVRVAAFDGVVVSASVLGEVAEGVYGDLPFRLGMTAEDAAAAVPPGAAPAAGRDPGSVAAQLGPRLVEASLFPPLAWVDDVDVAVSAGPPEVSVVTVRDVAVPAEGAFC